MSTLLMLLGWIVISALVAMCFGSVVTKSRTRKR